MQKVLVERIKQGVVGAQTGVSLGFYFGIFVELRLLRTPIGRFVGFRK
jgi:hypothetical protein